MRIFTDKFKVSYGTQTTKIQQRIKRTRQRRFSLLIVLYVILVSLVHFFVRPEVLAVFNSQNLSIPLITHYAPHVTLGSMALMLVPFFTHHRGEIPYNSERLDDGQLLIDPQEHNSFHEHLVLVIGLLGVSYLVISYVVPLYVITRFVGF